MFMMVAGIGIGIFSYHIIYERVDEKLVCIA